MGEQKICFHVQRKHLIISLISTNNSSQAKSLLRFPRVVFFMAKRTTSAYMKEDRDTKGTFYGNRVEAVRKQLQVSKNDNSV